MPYKKTKAGWVWDNKGTARIKPSRTNPFQGERTVRDTSDRPLVWDEKVGDFVVDTAKWIEEKNNEN